MSKQIVMEYVKKYKSQIDEGITTELAKRLEEVREISPHLVPIIEAMQELSMGGKRLRGILTILGYEMGVGNEDENKVTNLVEIVKAAVVMEIFHLGLLIQDDWMDRDELRRGVKTLHTRYDDSHTGNFVAMLAGDVTFGWGMEMLSGLELDSERVNKAIGVWGKYFTRVGYGQILDGLAVADEESLLQILALKSGEYTCVLPLQLGVSLAGGDEITTEQLGRYGMELGWVFQLRDDWLSEYGESEKTGKPVGNDAREGKRSFAVIYGREKLENEIARHMELGKKYSQGDPRLEGLLDWMATRDR